MKGLELLEILIFFIFLTSSVFEVYLAIQTMPSQRDQAVEPPDFAEPPDFPVDKAEKLSVDELVNRTEKMGELRLPTWMPGDVKLKGIYSWGGAILVYGDQDVENYRDGKITIQISKSTTSPTYDQLRNNTSGEVVKIGELNVVILEDAAPDPWMEAHGQKPILIYFWHEGFYYIVTGIKGEVSKEQMIEVIARMEPIGPNTMRKQSG